MIHMYLPLGHGKWVKYLWKIGKKNPTYFGKIISCADMQVMIIVVILTLTL